MPGVEQFVVGHDLKDGPLGAVVAAWESSASSSVAASGRGTEPPIRFGISRGVFIGALTPAFTGDKLVRIQIETQSVTKGGVLTAKGNPVGDEGTLTNTKLMLGLTVVMTTAVHTSSAQGTVS